MKRLALVGMPNTGKSTIFNRLTGASARVGNWPGLTVELTSARIPLGRHMVQVVDLPGIYDLQGLTEDEHVVQRFLQTQSVDLVAIVLNATQIDRQLPLALQVRESGLPCFVLLNMADEAERYGVRINLDRLQTAIGMPVAALSAKYGRGYAEALQRLARTLDATTPLPLVQAQAGLAARHDVHKGTRAALDTAVHMPTRLPDTWAQRVDRWAMHPWFGPLLFLLLMALVFNAVFTLGAPLQGGLAWVFGQVRSYALQPLLGWAPGWLSGLLLDGLYNGISTVAAFVPVIMLFFVFMTVIEESGYFSRAAFLTDSLMSRMGLDGRGFVMLLMGFGCNVPALMGTRIMRSRGLRLLTMLIIPFSLCSARLQVFLFIIAALFSPRVAPWVLLSLYGVSLAATFVSALVFKVRYPSDEPFVLELPPYRLPTLRQIALRAWGEIYHFLHRATKFIVVGVVLVWMLTNLPPGQQVASPHTIAGWVGHALHPAFAPLGIPPSLIIALIFGFVAKEIVIGSLAVIYGLQGEALQHAIAGQISPAAAYSFMLFTLIYTPCLSTVATLRSESGSSAYTLLSLGWSLGLAWIVSLAFYQAARLLGVA
jgi:ferrous iron transport protein B